MKVKFLMLLLFVVSAAFSQTKPIYFEDARVTLDPKKATAYGVYGKLSGQDLWVLKKYDFDDNLLVSGSYKDELLAEPHGSFTFYNSIYVYNDKNFTNYKKQGTDRYIAQKGNYNNGLEEGIWYNYYPDGQINTYYSFGHGKLNGDIRTFNNKGRLLFSGHYKEGLKDGIWYDLENKFKDVYERDSLVKSSALTRAEILKLK